MVEMGPCPKAGTPENFREREAPVLEKMPTAGTIVASTVVGIAFLASGLKGITQDPPLG